MVRIIELQTMMLSAETGIAEIDPRVLDAMREVPRHAFVPEPLRAYAYGDHPLPVGHEQNIAAPLLVALMTHLAERRAGRRGVRDRDRRRLSGGAAVAVSEPRSTASRWSTPLADQAARLLKELGYDNVYVQESDGYYGWPAHAPFDAIIVKEAIDHVPPPLLGQLKRGGRMVMPLGPRAAARNTSPLITKDADGKVQRAPHHAGALLAAPGRRADLMPGSQ